jgi:hypothetical protein
MAIGEWLGQAYNSLVGVDANGNPKKSGLWAQTLGAGYDYYQAEEQAKRDRQAYEAQLAAQQAIAQQQAQYAAARAAEETALRGGIVNRSQMLEAAINQARQAMGPLPTATQGDINTNYQQIRDMYRDDLNETIDRVSSQGYADAIAKGMDRSDRFRDTQRDLSREYAGQLRKIDQEAYNAAINRVGANQKTLMEGRENVYSDLGAGYQSGIDNLKSVMPTKADTAYSSAQTAAQDLRKERGETAVDSAAGASSAQSTIANKYFPNLDYMLGGKSPYVDPNAAKLAKLQEENRDLQNRIDRLGLSNGGK